MDKLKPYLLKIKQHHFWVLILMAILALFYAWSTGTAELENSFKKNKSSIDRQFSALKNKSKSRGGENFPNDKWIKKRRELTEKLKTNGQSALKNIHSVQREAQTWPQTLHPDSKVEIAENRWTQETVADYIDATREEIDRFRVMLGAADGPDEAGIFWDGTDFNHLKQSINEEEIKAEKDCKKFQQIVWVYGALLRAIAETNAGSKDPFNLPIYAIKDTAVFQEASENIDESAWIVREDTPVIEKKDGKKKSSRVSGKRSVSKKPPAKFQPDLRSMISKTISLDGYNVIAFRIKVRMQVDFLEPLLRSLANARIPMILEGVRFVHKPSLEVVKQPKPFSSRRQITKQSKSEISGAKSQQEKESAEKPAETDERGTLVEIWGFAYLARGISGPPPADASAEFKQQHKIRTVSK